MPPTRAYVRAVADHRGAARRGSAAPAQNDVLTGDDLADVDTLVGLLSARGPELDELLARAAARRDAPLAEQGRDGVVTYSPKVFVPLTRLCRDRCHYCTFATVPGRLPAAYLELDEVLDIAREGAAQGCTEVLFTLGDRPEARWRAAREWLDARGYTSTIDYVRAGAQAVLDETGLLPHLNPGVMSPDELAVLRRVAPSMGMMLESTSSLLIEPGGAHFGSPDKDPAVRLRALADAGRARVPFTSGILVGIGETRRDRAESLLALARLAGEYGHLQEVIVQNFRAKPDTAMRGRPDAEFDEFVAAVAVARLVMPLGVSVQAPPNLAGELGDDSAEGAHSARADQALLLRAGIDDWGGVSPVTPDHVNPERPWPGLDDLAAVTAEAGFALRRRLTVYPRYLGERHRGGGWLDPAVSPAVDALAGSDGLAAPRDRVGAR